jgi:hypothetical protein
MIDYDFEEGCTAPTLELHLPAAMEGTEGTSTLISMASVFDVALRLAHEKSFTYGDAWRRQGWMGNLARMMSKMSRLRQMLWTSHEIESSAEPTQDSALDLVNLAAFFVVNRSEENKWGKP